MPEIDSNNSSQPFISRLIVITLITFVIAVTIIAGKKATNKQMQETLHPTPSIITPTPIVTQEEVDDQENFVNKK